MMGQYNELSSLSYLAGVESFESMNGITTGTPPPVMATSNRKIGRICSIEGCPTQASFRFLNDKNRAYCAKHKSNGMVDFRSRKCEYIGCTIIASFNYLGLKKRRFCKVHAEPGMLYVRRKILPQSSADDKVEDQIDVGSPTSSSQPATPIMQKKSMPDSRKCEFIGCNKSASFNVPGSRKRRFCKAHSQPGMQYVNRRKNENSMDDLGGKALYSAHPLYTAAANLPPLYTMQGEQSNIDMEYSQRDSMMLSSLSGNMYSHNIFQCALPSIPDDDDEDDDDEEDDDDDVGSVSGGGGGNGGNSSQFQANTTNSAIDNSDYIIKNGRLFDERLLDLKMRGFQFTNNFIPTNHLLSSSSGSSSGSNVNVNNSIKVIGTNESMDSNEIGQNNSSSKGIHDTDHIQHHSNNILRLSNPTTTSDHNNNNGIHHANDNSYSNSLSSSDLHEYEMSLLYPLNRNNSEAQNALESTGYYYSNYLSKFNELNEVVNNEVNDHRNGLLDMNDMGNNRISNNSSSSMDNNGDDSNYRHSNINGGTMVMRNNLELLSDSSSCLSLQQLPVHSLLQHHHLLQQQQQQQQQHRLLEEDMMMRDSNNLTSLQPPIKQMVVLNRDGGSSSSDAGDEGDGRNILQYSQSSSYGVTTSSTSGMGQGHDMFGNDTTIQLPCRVVDRNSSIRQGVTDDSNNRHKYKPHYYCEFEGCQVLASCNFPSEGKKRFCGKHKLDGMVILNKPKCAFPGNCNVRPSFNFPGESSRGQYCFKHCLQGMQNVTRKSKGSKRKLLSMMNNGQ